MLSQDCGFPGHKEGHSGGSSCMVQDPRERLAGAGPELIYRQAAVRGVPRRQTRAGTGLRYGAGALGGEAKAHGSGQQGLAGMSSCQDRWWGYRLC